jgi:hypothetical protein
MTHASRRGRDRVARCVAGAAMVALSTACASDFFAGRGTPAGDGDAGSDAGDLTPIPPPDGGAPDGDASGVRPCGPLDVPGGGGDPCVLVDAYGVFVAPSGSDANPGTMAAPLRSISAAITRARATARPRVVACAGRFDEHVVVDASGDGVSVVGALTCPRGAGDAGDDAGDDGGGASGDPPWTYAPGSRAVVAPASAGYALRVDAVETGVTFEDFELVAPPASAAGESSIALFVRASSGVVLRRAVVRAGDAKDGAAGAPGANWSVIEPDDPRIAGRDAANALAGGQQACLALCASTAHSVGGAGGNGSPAQPVSGAAGGGTTNLSGISPYDGAGGLPGGIGFACQNGHSGASAPTVGGGTGAAYCGTLDGTGWTALAGLDGTGGAPGQGGGGGGGGISSTKGGGGGGACGGCGGGAGLGGGAGGSSFALLALESTITLDASRLYAGAGGRGGKGGDGQPGQPGGNGGVPASGGCSGGSGGTGGLAGGGGGGAGGISAGIGYVGPEPTTSGASAVTFASRAATGGAAGAGGNPTATKGADGVAQASVDLR